MQDIGIEAFAATHLFRAEKIQSNEKSVSRIRKNGQSLKMAYF
jgi:hypothetical protein